MLPPQWDRAVSVAAGTPSTTEPAAGRPFVRIPLSSDFPGAETHLRPCLWRVNEQ